MIYTPEATEQRRLRIKLALYAYAYEIENNSLISDHEYDRMSLLVDPSIDTGHEVLDKFFREQFDAYTGSWIHHHPELDRVKHLYECTVNGRRPYNYELWLFQQEHGDNWEEVMVVNFVNNMAQMFAEKRKEQDRD